MYEEFFGFSRRPFVSVPQVDRYYPGAAIEAARQTLVRCVERAEGVAMTIGPSGTGKTLLLMMLAEQFKDDFQIVLLSSGRLGARRALLQAILFELGRPYREMDEGELRLALVDHLTVGEGSRQGMLLLVDEAHTLPLRLLDEIRMITNLVSGGEPRTRLVLVGGPLLEERFASPKLESFSQRIAARCYLESFHREETLAYIHAQIGMAGREGREVVSDDACQAVYQATDGVPRLINQVCDHALLLACAAGRERIDRAVVEEAWADLQQLPTPWNGDSGSERSESGILEFGGLDDEPDPPEQASRDQEAPGDEAASVPMLRISVEPEEQAVDPVAQVDQIEQALAGLDEDFQPAGSIGPELELVFDESEDPFSEKFEEEEVLADRCGPTEATLPQTQPQSTTRQDSHEGSRRETPGKHPASMEDQGDLPESGDAARRRQEAAVASEAAQAATTDDRAATADTETHDHQMPGEWNAGPETVPMHGQQADDTAEEAQGVEPEEEDLIIVEEGYDDAEPGPPPPVATVRRQEYGRLFARLRRGG